MRFLDARQAATVAALFDGSLDTATCAVCGAPSAIVPTTIMVFDSPPGIRVLVGSLMSDIEEFGSFLVETFGVMAVNMFAKTRTPDDFRTSVRERLQPQVRAVRGILACDHPDGVARHLERHWRDLTASTFAVACAAVQDPARWPDLGPLTEADVALLAQAQAGVWQRVAQLARDGAGAPQLSADLRAYVAESSTVPGALAPLVEQLPPVADLVADYAANAVIAAVLHAAGQPNPRAARWAGRYVEMSRWCATSSDGAEVRAAYELPLERLEATISDTDLATALRTVDGIDDALARRIAGHAGRPEVADALATRSQVDGPPDGPAGRLPADATSAVAVLGHLRMLSEELVRTTDVPGAKAAADAAVAQLDGDPTARARVVTWLARVLIDMGRPQAAVEALGEASGDWEDAAEEVVRQELMLVRSTASMWAMPNEVAGLVAAAWLRQAETVGASVEFRRLFNRHAAEQMMRTGGPDMAAEMLRPQVTRELSRRDGDPRVVLDYARALAGCGRYGDALTAVRQALGMARADELHRPVVDAFRARLLAAIGSYRESATILFHWPATTTALPALIDLAAATTTIRREDPTWLRPGLKSYLWGELESAASAAGDAEEWYSAMRCLGAIGALGEACQLDDVMEHYWRLMLDVAATHGYPPDAEALGWLAARAFRRGDLVNGRRYLVQVPMGLASRLGSVRDASALPAVADPLRAPLASAMDALFAVTPPPAPLIRSVAEMQRDIIARAQVIGGRRLTADHGDELGSFNVLTDELPKAAYGTLVEHAAHTILDSTMNDEFLHALIPPVGAVAVVEWASHGAGHAAVLTTVRDDGTIDTTLLRPPDVDLPATARKVASRLAGWWPGRDGDPLDWEPWRRLEHWMVERLGVAFDRQPGHVVFIEPPWSGLPWHVVCAGRWTASYASGWTVLLEILRRPADPAPRTIGMLAAPALHEYPEVTAAFDASLARHRALVGDRLRLPEYVGPAADADAFRAMMADADVAKILCHGLVSAADAEVALMLASDGHLPPVHTVAADGPGTGRYRLSWRDCQRLPRTAGTVYSAACGTGQWHPGAWGDRLSLFRALRLRGTRTFVAPRWDTIATVVIPIIDEIIDLTVDGSLSVADAVEAASSAAAQTHPRWIARSLAVEGDWR